MNKTLCATCVCRMYLPMIQMSVIYIPNDIREASLPDPFHIATRSVSSLTNPGSATKDTFRSIRYNPAHKNLQF